MEEMMDDMQHIHSTSMSERDNNNLTIFDLSNIVRKISSTKTTKMETIPTPNEDLIGRGDIPIIKTFQSSDRNSDVSPQSLSERWGISIPTAALTLKKTTQRFLRSAILPLGRRY